jgi:hypothetical protein
MELLGTAYDFHLSSEIHSIYIFSLKQGMKFDTHVK